MTEVVREVAKELIERQYVPGDCVRPSIFVRASDPRFSLPAVQEALGHVQWETNALRRHALAGVEGDDAACFVVDRPLREALLAWMPSLLLPSEGELAELRAQMRQLERDLDQALALILLQEQRFHSTSTRPPVSRQVRALLDERRVDPGWPAGPNAWIELWERAKVRWEGERGRRAQDTRVEGR